MKTGLKTFYVLQFETSVYNKNYKIRRIYNDETIAHSMLNCYTALLHDLNLSVFNARVEPVQREVMVK